MNPPVLRSFRLRNFLRPRREEACGGRSATAAASHQKFHKCGGRIKVGRKQLIFERMGSARLIVCASNLSAKAY